MTTRAAIDRRTGRVIRGGWHRDVGVCRPGQNLNDIKAKRVEALREVFDKEDAEKRKKLEATVAAMRETLARDDVADHLRPIMEKVLDSAERNLASYT